MKHTIFLRKLPKSCHWGGFDNQLLDYFKRIDYQNNKVTLVVTKDIYSERLIKEKLPVTVIEYPLHVKKRFKHVWGLLRSLKPDCVVYAQGAFTDFDLPAFLAGYLLTRGNIFAVEVLGASKPARKESKKHFKVLKGVGFWWYKKRFSDIAKGRLCKGILAIGEEVRQRLIEYYHYPVHKVHVVHYGVNLRRYFPDADVKRIMREEFNVSPDTTLIVSTARLSKEKCVDRLINAFDRIAQQFPKLELFLVGNGPLMEELGVLANQKLSKDRIKFLGYQDDITQILKMSDVFALSSDIEGLSNAMLEAMATGLVSVVTATPGAAEVIEDGMNGFIVEKNEESVMNGLLKAMSLKEDRRREIAESARLFVAENFDVEKGIAKALNILQLNGEGGAHGQRHHLHIQSE